MKKVISMLTLLAVLFSLVISASATTTSNRNQKTVLFDETDYVGLSLEEEGEKKLREAGYSEQLIENMPKETVEKIGATVSATQTISYYMETKDAQGTAQLSRISAEEYETAVEEEMLARAQKIASEITVTDENGNVISEPTKSQISPQRASASIDSGSLAVTTTLYQVDGGQLSQYMVVSEFSWSTPPEFRGSDYFGITRDSNCSVVPGTFGNSTYYKEYRYYYLATNNGVVSSLNSTNDYNDSNLPNEDSAATGFVINFAMPGDVNPPSSMLVGSSFLSRNYANMQGGVWYQGVLQSPSVVPQNFNHFSTYWHQKSTKLFGGFSLSIPFGASFTVSPENKFSNPVEDTILATWNKK